LDRLSGGWQRRIDVFALALPMRTTNLRFVFPAAGMLAACSRHEPAPVESTPPPGASSAPSVATNAPRPTESAAPVASNEFFIAPPSDGSNLLPPSPAPSAQPPTLDPKNTDTTAREPGTSEDGMCDPEKPYVPSPDRRMYAVWQTFPMPLGKNLGMGTLRALEDSRVTKIERRGTHPVLPPCDLLPTRIELSDAAGKTLQVEKKWPQTDIIHHEMGPGATIIEIVEKVHCLASCWCGDGHGFWRIEDGKMVRHTGRVVEKNVKGTKPEVGAIITARGVTHGCYESSVFEKDKQGRPTLVIQRMAMGTTITATERHYFDQGEWKVSISEFKGPSD
ncbi:MAG TPA: hypothetical protein PKA58_34210, partial [Polyangium sp.]|nr:hypothetical protein [Polyangium sp.]